MTALFAHPDRREASNADALDQARRRADSNNGAREDTMRDGTDDRPSATANATELPIVVT